MTLVMPMRDGLCPSCRSAIAPDQASLVAAITDDATELCFDAVESLKSEDVTCSTSTSWSPEYVAQESMTETQDRRDPVAEFETAWRSGVPDIRDFLPEEQNATTNADRASVLVALIERDLCARWCPGLFPPTMEQSLAGRSVPDRLRLQDYIRQFPELGLITALPPKLVAAEFRVMLAVGESPQLDEYLANHLVRDGLLVDAVLPVLNEKTPQRPVLCSGFVPAFGRSIQYLFLVGFVSTLFLRNFAELGHPMPAVPLFVAAGITFLIVALGALGKYHPKEMGRVIAWRRPSLLHVAITFALSVPGFLLASSVIAISSMHDRIALMLAIDLTFTEKALLELARQPLAVMIAVGCLLPAFAEEMFFRAFVGRGLIRAYGTCAGVLLTSLFFGLFHGPADQKFFAFAFGIILHFVYLTTKSIFTPILLHALNNLLAFTYMRWVQSGFFNPTISGSAYVPPELLLISMLTFVLLIILLKKTQCRWVIADARSWTPGFVSGESPPVLIPAEPVCVVDFRLLKRLALLSYAILLLAVGITVNSWQGLSLANAAHQQIDEGRIDEAEKTSRRALSWAPKLAWTHATRAWVLTYAERYQEAREFAEQAIRIDPSLWFGHTVLGWLSHIEGRHLDAVEECTTALQLNDEDAFACSIRGAARFSLEESDEAIKDASYALQLDPELAHAFSVRGAARTKLGQLDTAIIDLSRSIELDATDEFAWSWRARARYEANNYTEAITDARTALEIDPENVIAQYYLGYALEENGTTAEAVVQISRYLELIDDDDPALLSRAKLLLQLGDAAPAIADLTELITRFPEDGELFSLRRQAYELLGDTESAIRDESKFDQICQSNKASQLWQLMESNEFHEAVVQADEALIHWPASVELYSARGTAKWNLGQHEAGFADYASAIELDPSNANLLESRGRLHFFGENYSNAIADFSRAIELHPDLASAYESRGQAYMQSGEQQKAEDDFLRVGELREYSNSE